MKGLRPLETGEHEIFQLNGTCLLSIPHISLSPFTNHSPRSSWTTVAHHEAGRHWIPICTLAGCMPVVLMLLASTTDSGTTGDFHAQETPDTTTWAPTSPDFGPAQLPMMGEQCRSKALGDLSPDLRLAFLLPPKIPTDKDLRAN